MNKTAILYALASAALFGASAPAAKVLLGTVHPGRGYGPAIADFAFRGDHWLFRTRR
jgi:hypothetical protein